jgi:hypothetical protein
VKGAKKSNLTYAIATAKRVMWKGIWLKLNGLAAKFDLSPLFYLRKILNKVK